MINPDKMPTFREAAADTEDYLTPDLAQLLLDFEPFQALQADILGRMGAKARDAIVAGMGGDEVAARSAALQLNAFHAVIDHVHSQAGRPIEFELQPIYRRLPPEPTDATHQDSAPAPHYPTA